MTEQQPHGKPYFSLIFAMKKGGNTIPVILNGRTAQLHVGLAGKQSCSHSKISLLKFTGKDGGKGLSELHKFILLLPLQECK